MTYTSYLTSMVCHILFQLKYYHYIIYLSLYTTHTGTTNYLRTPVDVNVFCEAAHQFCVAKPQFYPVEFSRLADTVLAQEMNMVHSDITHANCDTVFRTLTEFINSL